MKLKTDYTVSLTMEEAGKALSKFVEKKTGKKEEKQKEKKENEGVADAAA